jgi:hypothetical protein
VVTSAHLRQPAPRQCPWPATGTWTLKGMRRERPPCQDVPQRGPEPGRGAACLSTGP